MEGSIDVALVKEFYANLYVTGDKPPKQVRVRGHLINFEADSLNTFLETLVILEPGETLPTYSKFCKLRPDPQELAAQLCIPGRGFVLNAEGLPWKLQRKDLTTLAQTWSILSYFNLAPTSHTSNLNLDRARLSNSSRLEFPTLITALCMARGVTSNSLTFESFSLAINLAYIKKNSWNLDDPTTSTAPVPTTFGPSTQSTDLMMAMLQSIHQGQYMPSSHGGGEASAAQEPQPDPKTTPAAKVDDLEATPPESFVPETDPEADPVIVEASPQASPVSTPILELSTP
ncbi:hypothetical protein HKD37_18G050940 [Glycine soja]